LVSEIKELNATEPVSANPAARRLGLSSTIRAATHRALTARDQRLREYPRWEDWRDQARDLKAGVLARMDELLGELVLAVQAWGGQVLWARDAAQAQELVLTVARRHGVRAVVKAKSMTTEEIGLNQALEAAGLRSLETDLGEFIVQLAGHPPAHLTAPALHLNRGQIANLFARHLGPGSGPEPEDLTRQAAGYLKPCFGETQMGITGVNFATPDGTLVLLENENNLRLTATLPAVHLALMGIEKMIPHLAAAEVFLRLLAPSATGQRLTALTHFLKGLKGNQAFYLVILDNGRRELASDPEFSEALHCLRCGACLNVCPLFQLGAAHLYGRVYPGPIGILLAPFLAPRGDLADLCTQCGACQEICPVKIRLTEKILRLRRQSARFRHLRAYSGMAGAVLARPHWYRRLEPGLHRLAARWAASRGVTLPPESFTLSLRRSQVPSPAVLAPASRAADSPMPPPCRESTKKAAAKPRRQSAAALLKERAGELGATFSQIRGPGSLAHLLARAGEPLVLTEHPWLRRVAAELKALGVEVRFAGSDDPGQVGAAVCVALGAVPETGSVVADSGGPAALLSLRACKQVVVIPQGRHHWSLSQALETVGRQPPGMYTLLTGASRTADIEKVLVLGAQGPGDLSLVLYREEE